MPRFDKPLPLGLNPRLWPIWVILVAGAIRLASLADPALSIALQAWPEPVRSFFFTITNLGLSDWVLLPSLVIAVVAGIAARLLKRWLWRLAAGEIAGLAGFIFVAVGLPGLISNLIKRAVGRARPLHLDTLGAYDFVHFANTWEFESFPSGHTTTIFALAVVIGFLAPRWFWPALAVAILVGVSRVVVGMHYPTDVLGGVVCGALVAYVVRDFYARRHWVFLRRPDGTIVPRRPAAIIRLARGGMKLSLPRDTAAVPPPDRP